MIMPKTGMVVVHRDGDAFVLGERKTGDDARPLTGWWLVGGGGLADRALVSDDWKLLDPETVRQLWRDQDEAYQDRKAQQ